MQRFRVGCRFGKGIGGDRGTQRVDAEDGNGRTKAALLVNGMTYGIRESFGAIQVLLENDTAFARPRAGHGRQPTPRTSVPPASPPPRHPAARRRIRPDDPVAPPLPAASRGP